MRAGGSGTKEGETRKKEEAGNEDDDDDETNTKETSLLDDDNVDASISTPSMPVPAPLPKTQLRLQSYVGLPPGAYPAEGRPTQMPPARTGTDVEAGAAASPLSTATVPARSSRTGRGDEHGADPSSNMVLVEAEPVSSILVEATPLYAMNEILAGTGTVTAPPDDVEKDAFHGGTSPSPSEPQRRNWRSRRKLAILVMVGVGLVLAIVIGALVATNNQTNNRAVVTSGATGESGSPSSGEGGPGSSPSGGGGGPEPTPMAPAPAPANRPPPTPRPTSVDPGSGGGGGGGVDDGEEGEDGEDGEDGVDDDGGEDGEDGEDGSGGGGPSQPPSSSPL